MKSIPRDCELCQAEFLADPREVRRGNARFCGLSCSSKRPKQKRRNRVSVHCALCEKQFEMTPSKQKNSRSGLFFCCREHKDTAQKIGGIREIMPPHYGESTSIYAYRKQAFRYFEAVCARCGYDEYPAVLQVNHKNLDRTDNSKDNLEILCPTCHEVFHYLDGSGRYKKKPLPK